MPLKPFCSFFITLMLNISYMEMLILAVYDENAPVSPSQEEEDEAVEVCLFPFHKLFFPTHNSVLLQFV